MRKIKGYTPAEYARLKAATEGCASRLSDEVKKHGWHCDQPPATAAWIETPMACYLVGKP